MKFFAKISKRDDSERMVWGYASTEALDCQGEIITRDAMAGALEGYMKFANIREMHQPSAVGVAKEARMDENGLYIGVKVSDPTAWIKVVEGVYKGFSIGGNVIARHATNKMTITELELIEISLVDRPANPEALIEVWKMHKPQGEQDMANDKTPAAKAAEPEIKKGFWEISQLSDLCSQLLWIASSCDMEAEYEGDGSAVPAKLKLIARDACDCLIEMVAEETAEATASFADKVDDLKAASAKLGKSAKAFEEAKEEDDEETEEEKAAKAKAEEEAAAAAAEEEETDEEKAAKAAAEEGDEAAEDEGDEKDENGKPKGKSAKAAAAAPVDAIAKAADDLAKAELKHADELAKFHTQISEMADTLSKMSARVKELEDEPAAKKGVTKAVAVGKEGDAADVLSKGITEEDDFNTALKKVWKSR